MEDEIMKTTVTRQNIIEKINQLFVTGQEFKAIRDDYSVKIHTVDRDGSIALVDDHILTLESTHLKTGETDFFLHFDMNEDDELENKIQPFLDFLKSDHSEESKTICRSCYKTPLKVYFCCTGGVTSSYIAHMLNDKARELMINIHAEGMPWMDLKKRAREADLILLAPQISYLEKKLKAEFGDKVSMIPAIDFATFNYQGMLHTVMKRDKERKAKRKAQIEQAFSYFDQLAVLAACQTCGQSL